jgi:hypothetical protein
MTELRASSPLAPPPAADAAADEAEIMAEVRGLFAARRWAEAVGALDRIVCAELSSLARLQRNLARNLACLEDHRLALHDALVAAPSSGRIQPVTSRSGGLTLVERQPDGQMRAVGSNDDPAAEAAASTDELLSRWPAPAALVLAGAGDGHLLSCLAGCGRENENGSTRPVLVIEPDPERLIHILFIHDLAGPDGPIVQERFDWFVGDSWLKDFEHAHVDNPWRAAPELIVRQGVHAEAIADGVKAVQRAMKARDDALDEAIDAYYATLDAKSLAALMDDDPGKRPRRPRVMMPASRFTTVLQHAYTDAAEAFEALGWEVALLKEPALHYRLGLPAIRHFLDSFKPDLILLIDHLRSEIGDTFPANLPVATWTQDHLPKLTNAAAGRSVGLRDYILTTVAPWYTSAFEYPARQCLHLPKLTRGRRGRAPARAQGHDLVYVSNASATGEDLLDETMEIARQVQGLPAGALELIERCARALIDLYAQDESLPYLWHLGQLADATAADLGYDFAGPNERSGLLQFLNHPLNNTLYRQQALRWAAKIACELDLDFALYGRRWEDHPEFTAFAHGPVAYGDDLDALTRANRINLQIVPSFCLHQRMLDGLAAGGFYLVRPAPADVLMPRLAQFLLERCPGTVATVDEARRVLSGASLTALGQQLDEAECLTQLTGPIDLVAWVRCCLHAGVLNGTGEVLPRFDEIAFSDEDELRERVRRFLTNGAARREISARQWQAVEGGLTYEAGLRRIVSEIRTLLNDEVGRTS